MIARHYQVADDRGSKFNWLEKPCCDVCDSGSHRSHNVTLATNVKNMRFLGLDYEYYLLSKSKIGTEVYL